MSLVSLFSDDQDKTATKITTNEACNRRSVVLPEIDRRGGVEDERKTQTDRQRVVSWMKVGKFKSSFF